jgi:hypothetical protein
MVADRWQKWVSAGPPLAARRLMAALPLLLLAGLVFWRIQASLPEANSRGRPGDTALDRAAGRLARPLPNGAALFAAVDDALALQYLTRIWAIQPTLQVVNSADASAELVRGKPVLVTADAAATLLAELENVPRPSMQSAGPLWIALLPNQGIEPSIEEAITGAPAISLAKTITPGLALLGYTVAPAMGPAAGIGAMPRAVDLTLFWRIEPPVWPEGLAISVRPTLRGTYLPHLGRDGEIVQEDRPRPVAGMYEAPEGDAAIVADAYRVPIPDPLPDGADGLRVLLYRTHAGGFEDVTHLDLPLQ